VSKISIPQTIKLSDIPNELTIKLTSLPTNGSNSNALGSSLPPVYNIVIWNFSFNLNNVVFVSLTPIAKLSLICLIFYLFD